MSFSHPLARDAQVWSTGGKKGKAKRLLVIITTLQLNQEQKNFKADKVETLCSAAREWIDGNPEQAVDFLLMNRPKTWSGDKAV